MARAFSRSVFALLVISVAVAFRIATRVVKSKVRHPAEAGLPANRRVTLGSARPADTTPAERRKSRRFIASPLPSFLFCHFRAGTKVHFIPRSCNPSIDGRPQPPAGISQDAAHGALLLATI